MLYLYKIKNDPTFQKLLFAKNENMGLFYYFEEYKCLIILLLS